MKTKLMMIGTLATACAAVPLTAMPTVEEARRAEPVVRKLLAPERAAFRSGKKTRSEVAAAAMKLADEADTDAAKLLLMKGAFVLYVRDGNLAKAVEMMKALEAAISDMPPQSVTNMIEAALLGASKKGERARLYKLLDEVKAAGREETTTEKAKRDLARLFPGWTLASEVPQENRKEHASGFWANHRGQDNIVRFHPLNKETPVILKRTMKLSDKNPCLFLKVASFDGESDFVLSVRVNGKVAMPDRIVCTSDLEPWEDLVVPLFDWRGDSVEIEIVAKANNWWCEWSNFARIEIVEGNGQETCGLAGVKNGTETVDGYTWSYFIRNGGATVTAMVSPNPKGAITIPATLGGVKVTGLGKNLFDHCKEVTSVAIPEGVTSIGQAAFNFCYGLKSVAIPSSVKTIGAWAFSACFQLQPVTMPESLEYLGKGAFINCRSFNAVNLPAKLAVISDVAFGYCSRLGSVTIPASVTKIGGGAFGDCGELTEVTMLGERPEAPKDLFPGCGKLKAIHVPANAKSWAGMKEWQGIPLVFDGKAEANSSDSVQVSASNALTGPYGIRMQPDPGCEKGAEYVLKRLVNDYLPVAVRYYGDPFGGKEPSRVYTLHVKRNDGKDRKYTGPSWGGREDWKKQFTIGLAKGSDKWDMDLTLVANKILCVCSEDVGFHLYVNDFIRGDAKGIDPVPEIKEMIRKGLAKEGDEKKDVRLRVWRKYAPMWAAFEELRARHPNFMLDYCNLKNSRYAEGKLPQELSFDQMADLLGEVTGENMVELFKKYGVGRRESQKYPLPKISVAQALQSCDFLLNKDFKKNAKYYLCLFSASWCPPCRAEMPRIARTYAETLKDDPNIELIHFSRDQNDEKALAWAKEHDVKFPVVKPNGGNPLDLQTSGIPHLFIVKADGTLVEEGHPKKLFTEEKLRELKVANGDGASHGGSLARLRQRRIMRQAAEVAQRQDAEKARAAIEAQKKAEREALLQIQEELRRQPEARAANAAAEQRQATVDGYTWSYRVRNGEATIMAEKDRKYSCAVSPTPTGDVKIPATLGGIKVTHIGPEAFKNCKELTSVTIPEGVTHIDTHAFGYCDGLKSVTLPSSLKDVGYAAFGKCAELTSVTIPNGVKSIGADAFNGCGLKSVVIPESVTHIGDRAFCGCRELESVAIAAGVVNLGKGVFAKCNAIKLINVDSRNPAYTAVDGVLYTKDRSVLVMWPNPQKAVSIPEGVTNIVGWAFAGGSGMTSVTIPESVTSIGDVVFLDCPGLKSITIPSRVKSIGEHAFEGCRELTEVTMLGERPEAPKDLFPGCGKLKAIHVPANAKSWAGMKEWQGIPLVFDGKVETNSSNSTSVSATKDLTGPYGILMQPDPGCEKGAEYVLKRLVDDYLPAAVRYYGDPFGGKTPSRVYRIVVKRNKRNIMSFHPGSDHRWKHTEGWTISLPSKSDKFDILLEEIAASVLTVCEDPNWTSFTWYVNKFVCRDINGGDPIPQLEEDIRIGLSKDDAGRKTFPYMHTSMWAVLRELHVKHPKFIQEYCDLKNAKYNEGKLPGELSFDQMAELLGEVTGENVSELFKKYGVGGRFSGTSSTATPLRKKGKLAVAKQLQECDFLLNKDFKKNAKYYLCLFSASWCPPCRAEMPRIAKTYAETLRDDPDIELIHFSRDQNDEKALAWAKEHDVKFPVVKPNGGNPLDLHTRGIPHLFIVKADGTLVEEGHPKKLFTEEKLRELKVANGSERAKGKAMTVSSGKEIVAGIEWTYNIIGGEAQVDYASSSNATGAISIPSTLGGFPVTSIGRNEFRSGFGWRVFEKCCKNMTSVTIPSGVVNIGDSAFSGCSNLVSVTIPASVTNIARCAFSRCASLTSFAVDEGNTKYSSRNGLLCSKDGSALIAGVNGNVTIPPSVKDIADYAFQGRIGLKSVMIPSGVTSVGLFAFSDCSGLKSVAIPASMKKIGWYAFSGCSELMSFSVDSDNPSFSSRNGMICSKDGSTLVAGVNGDVTIPPCVKEIGSHAFLDYSGLKSVRMPESVTSIGDYSFVGCNGLTAVTIPASVTYIGVGAFYRCGGLKTVTLPSSVTSIGRGAVAETPFYDDMPDGLVVLGGGVFYKYKGECPSSVTIPSNVTSIGEHAFRDCSRLESLTIPSTVTNIDGRAFAECPNLKTVHVMRDGKGETMSFDDFFKPWRNVVAQRLQRCDFLLNKDFKRDAKVYLCLFSASWCGPCRAEMPRIAKTYAESLKDNPNIELILFSRDQNDEDALAWAKEHGVKFPVVKPNGGNPLDLHAHGIPHLFIVKSDGTLVEEGHPMKLFTDEKLRSLTTANEDRRIKGKSTSDELRKDEVKLPYEVFDGAVVLGSRNRLKVLRKLLGEKRKEDGEKYAAVKFSSGALLIPDVIDGLSVRGIAYGAFFDCKGMTSVTIPSSVSHVADAAFHDLVFSGGNKIMSFSVDASNPSYSSRNGLLCSKDGAALVAGVNGEVTIPSCVKSIKRGAFYGCRGLKSVTIPEGVEVIAWDAFQRCTSLKSVTLPSSVTNIGVCAFCKCSQLKSVRILEGVTDIGSGAFKECGRLEFVTIPSSVKRIGKEAFFGCNGLAEMTMLGERPEAPNDIFKSCGKLKSIHVPANAKSWAGMKEWQGIPLVFDGEVRAASEKALNSGNATSKDVPNVEYKFSYKLEGGNAIITGIDPKPVGTLVIPDKIDGHKVTNISGGRGYNDDSPFWSGCEQMTKVVLPAGLEKSEGFCNCKSLSSIEISRSNKNFASHDGALYTKDFSTLLAYPKTLESVKLSPKTRKIGACAFRGCALKTANLPKGIMEVEPWNLCECPDLELIEFPKSLKYLGQCAACGSGKLKKIVFNGDAPQIGLAQFSWGKQVVFTGAPADLVVEVRKGTKGWKSPGSRELPERWPTNQDESRPIRYIK